MNETQILLGKKKMLRMKMSLRSNRNESMAYLIKAIAKENMLFFLHNGEPSTTDINSFFSSYKDFRVFNNKNFNKILRGEKIVHFNAEMVDIPAKARPQL